MPEEVSLIVITCVAFLCLLSVVILSSSLPSVCVCVSLGCSLGVLSLQ